MRRVEHFRFLTTVRCFRGLMNGVCSDIDSGHSRRQVTHTAFRLREPPLSAALVDPLFPCLTLLSLVFVRLRDA